MKFETLVLILPLALSISTSVHGENGVHRRILHQPLFPVSSFPPSPPDSSGGDHSEQPFFPEDPNNETQNTTPVAPPSPTTNGSLPISTATHPSKPTKRAAIAISIGIVALGTLSALLFFIYRNKAKNSVEEQKLEEVNRQSQRNEDGSRAPPPSSFLYIGTVDPQNRISAPMKDHKLSPMKKQDRYRPSPDLMPLPPLKKATASSSEDEGILSWRNSKRNSPGSQLPASSNSSPDVIKHAIIPSIKTTPPRQEAPSLKPLPPERKNGYVSEVKLSLPRRAKFGPPPPPPNLEMFQSISDKSHLEQKVSATTSQQPLPPPPFLPSLPAQSETVPPKVRSTWTNFIKKPSESDSDSQIHTAASLRQEVDSGGGSSGRCDGDDVEDTKPKLKPLHWHKVRASSERATVWDQMKPSSFKLNEDRMESLFGSNSNKLDTNGTSRKSVVPPVGTENRVLDPKKSQNIAILLRALNVTRDEVSEALLDGNSETLGAELLETLVKMAPTREEEIKLTGYKGDTSKLGSAEKFLKAVLDIPFAFKRVEAMLYMANFDAEVQYLRKSFRTLEAASIELKSSRLFLKLLKAVLTTGNRMNVGTNRGGAKSFKLDTLLKLVDIKGTDGKTTLLHFVVQEIIKSEYVGSATVTSELGTQTNSKGKEEEFRRQGLIIVAGLSREIGTVKLAAGMDSDVLRSNISKLEIGLQKVRTVLQYEKSDLQGKFFESIKAFHSKAEEEICRIKENERKALTLVREVTEYFHGDVGKEEAHPLRIFMTVKDFLSSLDYVCKDVGTMQDRPIMGAARSFRISANIQLPVLSRYNVRQDDSSSEESSSPWNN